MKLAVIGSRDFEDMKVMRACIDPLQPTAIISGGAKGADTLAKQYAEEHGIHIIEHKPDWKRFGRGAGIVRNKTIIDDADYVLAFWDGTSRGTKHSIHHAKQQNKPLTVITFAA